MDLRAKPFYLSDEDIAWVEDTLASMTLEEKVGQMFCVTDTITDVEELQAFVKRYHPGGFMYRCGDAQEIQSAQRAMQAASRIPLLLACNLESGGNGVAVTGTFFGREMEVAATGGVVRDAEYGADITLKAAFPAGTAEKFQARLTELSAGSLTMTAVGEEFLPGLREEAN